MKIKAFLVFLVIPVLGYGQQPPQLTEEQIQQMMQQAGQVHACFSTIDQSKLDALATKAQQMEAELKNLCSTGKRSVAEKTALKFAMEMSSSEEVKALRKCGENMRSMMPAILFADGEENSENKHICDGM